MKYLASITLKKQPGPEVLSLIASELSHSQKLKHKGIIDNTWFEIDETGTPSGQRSWFLFNANTKQEVEEILTSFPMYEHLDVDVEIKRVGVRWDDS